MATRTPSAGPSPATVTAGADSPRQPPLPWPLYAGALGAGLAVRLAFALGATQPALPAGADEFYYRAQGQLLTHGHFWVQPGSVTPGHPGQAAAAHPPLFSALLGLGDLAGLHSMDAQRAALCVVSVTAVVFCGRLARRLGGAGLEPWVAWTAALAPGMWIYDGQVLSETVTVPLVAATLLAFVRLRERPGGPRAALCGGLVALCVLTRPEVLAFVVLFGPWWCRGLGWRRAARLAGAFVVPIVVLVGPWVGRNLADFQQPEFVSANLGSVVAGANCPATYAGPAIGTWVGACVRTAAPVASGDPSVLDHAFLHQGTAYIAAHAGRLPAVVAARLVRALGVWPEVSDQAVWDARSGGIWPTWAGWVYLVAWLAGLPLVVMAALALRGRWRDAWPHYALVALYLVVCAVFYDNTRFAASAQPALAVLCGLGLWRLVRHRRAGRATIAPVSLDAPPLTPDAAR